MKAVGAEAIKAALWRSRWIFVGLMLLGAISFNLFSQFRGPEYSATSQVLVSHTDLAGALTGSQATYVAPERIQETELALANSLELYERAASSIKGILGSASVLDDSVSVSGKSSNDVLYFTATDKRPGVAVEKANLVASEYSKWRGELSAEPIKAAIERLSTRMAAEGASASLQESLQRLQVLETLTTSNVQVVERATTATQTRPKPVSDTVVGASLGLLFGLVVMAASELLNTSVRSEQDAEEALGVAVIGATPQFPRGSDGIVAAGKHRARYEDTFALLAAEIERQSAGVGNGAVVAVTSAGPGEGKSSTACNLAIVLAQNGHRCLLIDFDLRRPSIAGAFGIPAKATGVQEIVRTGLAPAGTLWRVSVDDRLDVRPASPLLDLHDEAGSNLDVIPSGTSRGPLRDRGDYERMREVIHTLRAQYDWIVIDTPPALRTTEVTQIAAAADAVLIVARYGFTSKRSARALGKKIPTWRSRSVNTVLAGVPPREDPAGYYAYAADG